MFRTLFMTSCAALVAGPAWAAADLAVGLSGLTSPAVYASATYTVDVSNHGNRTAEGITLTIGLPATHTSPGVYVMGVLGAYDGRCNLQGTDLVCALGALRKNRGTAVSFELALPQSAAPLVITADARTTTNENNLADNTGSLTPSPTFVATPITGPAPAHNRHCTGQSLTAFFECTLFPGSIGEHDIVLEANQSVTIVGQPGYGGTWSQPSPERLLFQYSYNGQVVADFEGDGVGGGCFEGLTTFPGSPYVAPYEVCL